MKKYKKLLNIENYPLNVDLVKGYYCNGKKIKTYNLSLEKNDYKFLLQRETKK
jgi:hypothetical protein